MRPSAIIDQAYRKDKVIYLTTNPADPGFNKGDYCEIGEEQNGNEVYKIIGFINITIKDEKEQDIIYHFIALSS